MHRIPKSALVAAVVIASSALASPQGAPGQGFPPPAQVAAARQAFIAANPSTFLTVRDLGITRIHGKAFSTGATPHDSAEAFVQANAGLFGITPPNLSVVGPFGSGEHLLPLVYDEFTNTSRFTLVSYTQQLNGIPVFRSDLRVLVRNEPGFPTVLASSSIRDLGTFAATFTGRPVAPGAINTGLLLRSAGKQFAHAILSDIGNVIFAGVDDSIEAARLAYKFVATSGTPTVPGFQKVLFVVDASNGSILYQENLINEVDAAGSITGLASEGTASDACETEISFPLPYSAVTFAGSTYYADANGDFAASGIPGIALQGSSTVGGKYFVMTDPEAPIETVNAPIGPVMSLVHNAANSSPQVRAQVNGYLQANLVRDMVLAQNPSYPVISGQEGATAMTIIVNDGGQCNAFYLGNALQFLHAGGGCPNTAFATVVHHEFGHHVVQSGGSGQGAYGEGTGDCVGILMTDESATGIGFFGNCAEPLRDANNNCQYSDRDCSSCGDEEHACGMLLSGCVWSLRNEWAIDYPSDYLTRLRSIVVNAVPLHGGTSSIQPDIVIDYLTLDDDNGDISDGTPNYESIAAAFGAHGLNAPPIQPIKFSFPNGLPTNVLPDGTTQLVVDVLPLTGTPQPDTGKFFYRIGTVGPFSQISMPQTTPNHYEVSIPASACLSTMQFYVQAQTTTALNVNSPPDAPTTSYSAVSVVSLTPEFTDSIELSIAGWTLGAGSDNATTGQWVAVDPNGTAAQPESDHTEAGTTAWITGQGSLGGALGEADVDGGATTLISPSFNATGYDAVYVSYWRWYSNDTGSSPNSDSMPVSISNNDGASWVQLENVTENANAWVLKSFKVSDFVTPTATMKLRWVAQDQGAGSLVEAGVDDVAVTGYQCTAELLGDLNGDGSVNAADLTILLGGWGGNGSADLNDDGIVDAADLTILLGAWTG